MKKTRLHRIHAGMRWLIIPASIFSAIVFHYFFFYLEILGSDSVEPHSLNLDILTVATSAVVGGWLLGMVVAYFIAFVWNTYVALKNRKSGNLVDALQCGMGEHEWSEWAYVKEGNCRQRRHCVVCGEKEEQVDHDRNEWQYTYANTIIGMPEHATAFENLLNKHFNQSELCDFCFRTDLDPDNLKGDSKIEQIRSLIDQHNQKRSIAGLVSALKIHRTEIRDNLDSIFDPSVTLSESALKTKDICRQHSDCLRCGDVEVSHVHYYTDWKRITDLHCDFSRICLRCDEEEEKTEHQWGTAQYVERGACQQIQVCHHCNEEKPLTEKHIYENKQEKTDTGRTVYFKICARCGHRK